MKQALHPSLYEVNMRVWLTPLLYGLPDSWRALEAGKKAGSGQGTRGAGGA